MFKEIPKIYIQAGAVRSKLFLYRDLKLLSVIERNDQTILTQTIW